MDAEITALEEKLSKARQVKAGMMSELLGEGEVGVRCKISHAINFMIVYKYLDGKMLSKQ